MAKTQSFDISTGVDLQEVDNAVNQATKEILTRYDFKGTKCTFEFDRDAGVVKLDADDEYRLQAQIQGDEVRVIAPSRDTLQDVIGFMKKQDYGMELSFGNYR